MRNKLQNYLVVDGYNMIGAWPELIELKKVNLEATRDRLIELMSEYQGITGYRVIIVFDAYFVRRLRKISEKHGVQIIYSKEKESADSCIEKLVKRLKNINTKVYVATSDYAEQNIILGQGALRKSARELLQEMQIAQNEIKNKIKASSVERQELAEILPTEIKEKFEKWRREKSNS